MRAESARANLLFTSVGRRVELLRAFRRAHEALQIRGNIVALDVDPLAPGLQVADRPYLAPRLTSDNYVPALLEICRREEVSLVFPLIDPDIAVLAANREAIIATGATPCVVSEEAAAMAADKWQTMLFFRSLGLPTPRSWLPEEARSGAAEGHFPLFIKPRRGSAGKQAFQVHDERQLRFFLEYIADPIVQECLPGPEITNDVICNWKGELLAIVSRERIETRWGEVATGVTVFSPAIMQACERIAAALPAVGPVTVQCMMKDGEPHFTEINARYGGGAPLGVAAGADSPKWLLAQMVGLPVEIPPLGAYKTGLFLTRFDDSFFLSQETQGRLARSHV